MVENYAESEEYNVHLAKEDQAEQEESSQNKLTHLAICFPDSIL